MCVYVRSLFLVFLFSFVVLSKAFAQDYNFSQFWENRTYYNPAFVGLKHGELNGVLTYRRLWPKFDGNFSTIHFAADLKTYNNYGFGLNAISSDEGAGLVKSNALGLSYSWRGYINKERNIFFQLGVKGSFTYEHLNYNKYVFHGQLDPIYGNIFPQPALDGMKQKQTYWDFSTGALLYLPARLHNQSVMDNYIGIAVHHFTRPKDNFIETDVRIPIKVSFQWHSSLSTGLYSLDRKSKLQIRPGLIFENQGEKLLSSSSFNTFIFGMDVASDPIFAGIWYNSQLLNKSSKNYTSIIFKLGLKVDSDNKKFQYKITYTYDMSLGNLVKSMEGSHEIGLSVSYRFNARYNYNIYSF